VTGTDRAILAFGRMMKPRPMEPRITLGTLGITELERLPRFYERAFGVLRRPARLFLALIAGAAWLAGGCASPPKASVMATPPKSADTFFKAERVAKIIIADTSKQEPIYLKAPSGQPLTNDGQAGGMAWTDSPFTECTTITNQSTIAELVTALNSGGPSTNSSVTLDSILAHQYFFDRQGLLIAHVRVICHDSTVLFSVGSERLVDHGGQPCIRTTDWPRLVTLARPQYCRLIYDLMQPHCGERIAFLHDLYQKRGLSLEDRLFGK
jgi:hypothetical protein